MGKNKEERQAKKDARKIEREMKKEGIGQSDGLVVEEGEVKYDKFQDGRSTPMRPTNVPNK